MRDARKAIFMAVLCHLALPGIVRSAEGLPKLEDADLNQLTGDLWFRASLMGTPVGYVHATATLEDGPILRNVETMSLKIDFGRGPVEVSATTVTEYDRDLKPCHIHSEQNEFGRPKSIDAVLEDGQLRVTTKAGDLDREKRLTVGSDFGSEMALSMAAAQGALPDQATYTFQTFVPELEQLVDFEANCLGREKVQVNGEAVEGLKVDLRAKSIGLQMQWWLDSSGNLIKQQMPSLMNLVVEKVTEEEALAGIAPFVLSDHIAVAERMGSARALPMRSATAM